MEQKRKEWFRDRLIAWVKQNRKAEFSNLNSIEQSKEMTRFYVKEVLAKVSPGCLPDDMDEIDDYLVDGPNDGGADFIYRSENSVLIIQSKFRGRDKREEIAEFTHFCSVVQRLYEAAHGTRKLNRKVMDAISAIDWDSDSFDLRFCTLGKTNDDFNAGTPTAKDIPNAEDRVIVDTYNETALNDGIRDADTTDQTLQKPISIRFASTAEGHYWLKFESASNREMFVGIVSGMELAELAKTERYRLFTMNIRDYVGETSTNRGIVDTASERPQDFLFFNNGVSAVATQIRPDTTDPSRLHCEQFSIINGAQTVRSLLRVMKKSTQKATQKADLLNALKNTRVLFRVMQFRPTKDRDFPSDVTKFNNTQNSIKISDFRSNDPVQVYLRKQFAQVSVGAKSCEYKNKRFFERDSNKFPIGMEDFAKTIYSFRYGPDDMEGGTRYLFDTSSKGGYAKVFGDGDARLSDEEFELAAGTFFLCHEVCGLWKKMRESDSSSPALERRWLLFFTVGELFRRGYAGDAEALCRDLSHLANPNAWMQNPAGSVKKAIKEAVELAASAMEEAYNDESAKPDFRHRNWFRTDRTRGEIRRKLEFIAKIRKADFPRLRPRS
jgi:hypothetical protein